MSDQTNAVWFCGDPHGAFEHIIQAVHEYRPAAIILLGDMDSERPLDIELAAIEGATVVYYIPGNHDTDTERAYDNMAGSSIVNLHGRVLEIAGLRIAGLGGVFRSPAWNPRDDPAWDPMRTPEAYMATLGKGNLWRKGMPLRHRSTIFPSEVCALAQQRADVLVTHEAPHHHDLGFEALTKLATAMEVKKAYHGHHHYDITHPDGIWRRWAAGDHQFNWRHYCAWCLSRLLKNHSLVGKIQKFSEFCLKLEQKSEVSCYLCSNRRAWNASF